MIDKVIVDKTKLTMMMSGYWAIDNNETCAGATILFLREIGFSTHEINKIVSNCSELGPNRLDEIKEDMKAELEYYKE